MMIFIIEDDKGLSHLMKDRLKTWEYKMGSASSGKEAMAYLVDHSPDLVILDYNLPDMNGEEFLGELRKRDFPLPPFIVSTGQGDERIAVEMMKLGARDYLVKDPSFLHLLPAVVRRVEQEMAKEKRLKAAEEEIRKLSHFLEQSPVSVVITDLDGNIEYVNPKFSEITGYSSDEILGKNPRILQSGEHPKEFYEKLWKTILSRETWKGELRNRKKNGEFFWEEATIGPFKDAAGKVTHFIAIKKDITERKKLERTHSAVLKLYQTMENSTIDEVIQLALEEGVRLTESTIGYFHFVNQDQETISLQKWTGATMKHCSVAEKNEHYLISQAGVWVDCFHAKKAVIHNDYPSLSHKKGLPEGHVPVLRDLGVPVFEKEKITAIIGVGNKTTEYSQIDIDILSLLSENTWNIVRRKRAEEETKKLLEEKELLLHEVHHRIKNNMSTMISLLKLQSREIAHPETVEAFKSAEGRIRSMMLLYEKLYHSENLKATSIKSYLSLLVKEIMGNFSRIKRVRVETQIDDFEMDIKKISPLGILVNELLTNAMKHAFSGIENGKIFIALSRKEKRATLVMEDNGTGLPESVNLESATGFGLKLVKLLAEQMDGHITLERKGGTRYTIDFEV